MSRRSSRPGPRRGALRLRQVPRPPGRRARGPGRRGRVKTYPLVGEVLKVEPEEGKVTIRHEAIPGYMPAMTMPFERRRRRRGRAWPTSRSATRSPRPSGRRGPFRTRRPDRHRARPAEGDDARHVGQGAGPPREDAEAGARPGRARLRGDDAGGRDAAALRPARQGRRPDVHLHELPAARVLPEDGREVRRAVAAGGLRRRRGRRRCGCSRSASTRSTTRPRCWRSTRSSRGRSRPCGGSRWRRTPSCGRSPSPWG